MSSKELRFLPNLGNWIPLLFTSPSFNIVEISNVKFGKWRYNFQIIISFYFLLYTCFCYFSYPLHKYMLFTWFLLQSSNSMHWCQHLKGERRTEVSMKKMATKDGGRQERYQRFTSEKTFHTAFAHVTTDEGKMKKYPCKFWKASVCCAKLPDNGLARTNHFVLLVNYLLYHHLKPVQFLQHKCLENCRTSEICTKHK